jgi:hypothetical protein
VLLILVAACGKPGDEPQSVDVTPGVAVPTVDPLLPASPAGTSAGEVPIEVTSPSISAIALRYQPILKVTKTDRFWPVSVLTALQVRWQGRTTCLRAARDTCPPTVDDISHGGTASEYLDYPASLVSAQDEFYSFAPVLGIADSVAQRWREDPDALLPQRSAQMYFYYSTRRAYPKLPSKAITLQYWFYYPFNYFPKSIRSPFQLFSDPAAGTMKNLDYHQGDFEHVAVVLDPASGKRYVWMARHATGKAFSWDDRKLQKVGDHPVIYAAFGSHASFNSCGTKYRFILGSDYVSCEPAQHFTFEPTSTPLVDLGHVTWSCWRGHFGTVPKKAGLRLVAGPRTPLRQQDKDHPCGP